MRLSSATLFGMCQGSSLGKETEEIYQFHARTSGITG